MRTPTSRGRIVRMARWTVLGTLATMLSLPPAARAHVTCALDDFGQPHVRLWTGGDSVTLRVVDNRISFRTGAAFQPCGSATRFNTDLITVRDMSGGNTRVAIDLRGGAFAPGATDEAGDSDEIEWSISLGPGREDFLTVIGTLRDDSVFVGHGGFNLNVAQEALGSPDNDARQLTGVNRITLLGDRGDDELRGSGKLATGDPVPIPMRLFGGPGNDSLDGGRSGDSIDGGPGFDHISGGRGRDLVSGQGGGDEMAGGRGNDSLSGGSGKDSAWGGNGGDQLRGARGDDDLRGGRGNDSHNGGEGHDHCEDRAGTNTFAECDTRIS